MATRKEEIENMIPYLTVVGQLPSENGDECHEAHYRGVNLLLRTPGEETNPDMFKHEAKMHALATKGAGEDRRGIFPMIQANWDKTPYTLTPKHDQTMDLSSRISQEREGAQIDNEENLRILSNVAQGIANIHRGGVVHGNICPRNIILGTKEPGAAYLKGFEEATETNKMHPLHKRGFYEGRDLNCIAPEEVRTEEEANPAADIYSFGCTAYQTLTGKPPYEGSPAEIVTKHLNEKFPKARETNPSIPSEVEQIINRATEKRPENRPTAQELAKELTSITSAL
jgi:serine/threonine protein kinase